jgi:hypothetical protein
MFTSSPIRTPKTVMAKPSKKSRRNNASPPAVELAPRPRVRRASAANPGAADVRAHGRAYRAPRESHGSQCQADYRWDAGKARARFTCWFVQPQIARLSEAMIVAGDMMIGGRSSGDGPDARADGRTRPLSRLRAVATPRPGGGGVAPPRNVDARDAVGAGRRAREIFLPASYWEHTKPGNFHPASATKPTRSPFSPCGRRCPKGG